MHVTKTYPKDHPLLGIVWLAEGLKRVITRGEISINFYPRLKSQKYSNDVYDVMNGVWLIYTQKNN